jgi:hypothetical protein
MTMGWNLLAIAAVSSAVLGVLGGFYWAHRSKTGKTPPTPFSRVLGVCMLVMALGAGAQLIFFQSEQRRISDCQFEVNKALISALNARNSANAEQNQKLIDMVRVIRTAKSPDQSGKALDEFITASEELKTKRQQNPFPDVERCK